MSHIPPPPILPAGSTVWAYLRDSGGESQEQSTIQQRREIEAYCRDHRLVLVQCFEDKARSGGTLHGRIEFLGMIDQSHLPSHPAGLLVWNYARFARDMDDSAFYRALLRKNGMVVHSLTDPIPVGEFSRVIESLIDYANEEKRRQNSRDVKRALADRVKAGYASGGTPPRGYLTSQEIIGTKRNGQPRIGSRWTVDPGLGPLATLAFTMRSEGKPLLEIIRATHGRLYKGKNSWTTFFRNRTYLGFGKCGDLEIPDHHPALIDAATFKRVQEVNKRAQQNRAGNLLHPRRVASPSLLSGIAVCTHCGAAIVKDRAGRNKWDFYVCGKKRRTVYNSCEGRQIGSVKADRAILDAVIVRILTPEFAAALMKEITAQLGDTARIDRKEREARLALASIEKSINRLLDTIEKTRSNSAHERLVARELERKQIQDDLKALQVQRRVARLEISQEALSYTLDVWRGEIEAARSVQDVSAQRSVLQQFLTRIELGYNVARIWYSFPLSALANTERTNAPVGAQHESPNQWGSFV